MSKNVLFLLGMCASIAVAIAPNAKEFDHPWDHILSLGGLAGTAITGYLSQKPRREWSDERRQEHRDQLDLDRLADEDPEA
jgi:hypothetical protein